MAKVLIIAAGGVRIVVVRKCAEHPEVFTSIALASRTKAKCDAIAEAVKKAYGVTVETDRVDADDVADTVRVIKKFAPDLVVNVALPYQDLTIMDACLEAHVNYLDTANYEPKDVAHFEYSWQWAYREKFEKAGLMAVLGCGFDPGVTNLFCAYAQKHLYDTIRTVDILDCNAGSHGHAFATNFNPEINIREVTQVVRHWEDGQWVESPAILNDSSIHFDFDYPVVGKKDSYLLYHEEMESLVKHIKGLEKIRFWMTFSQNYINHLRVLQNVGMTRIDPVEFQGQKIVPIQFLKALLPDPGSLGHNYSGKTVIGCVFEGQKNGGEPFRKYIYNVCDHAECYAEVEAQAISYTTGVPAMVGAMMMLTKVWKGEGVYNVEQLDPDPFLEKLAASGLPWTVTDFEGYLPE